ncbi:MAG TPA: hypothetical protein VIV60_35395 [Polyangiaceae bacterium]
MQQVAGESLASEGCVATMEEALITKQHPAGAATDSGMEDILIAPAELIAGSEHSPFTVCGAGQHCLVRGANAGSIDTVKPFAVGAMYAARADEAAQYRITPEAYGFRCVVGK